MPSAELIVIRSAVNVMSVFSYVGQLDRDESFPAGLLEHTVLERALKGLFKEGQDVKAHVKELSAFSN